MLDEHLNGPAAAHASGRLTHHSICAHDATKKAVRIPREANQPPPILPV